MEDRSSEEIAKRLQKARVFDPKTAAGRWEQQATVRRLEDDFVFAKQAEKKQLGGEEVSQLRQLAMC